MRGRKSVCISRQVLYVPFPGRLLLVTCKDGKSVCFSRQLLYDIFPGRLLSGIMQLIRNCVCRLPYFPYALLPGWFFV